MEFIESYLTAPRRDTGWPVNWPWEQVGGGFHSSQAAKGRAILALLSGAFKALQLGDASIQIE